MAIAAANAVRDQFENCVNKTDSCWLWTGKKSPFGYGVMRGGMKKILAHRFSWEISKGPIPKGFNVLHDCPGGDNPACVNPEHLFLGTQKDNMNDAARKNRTSYGEHNGCAKLSREQVFEARERIAKGETQHSIAVSLGVSRRTIGSIHRGITWGWL